MNKTTINNTGISVSRIALGTASLHHLFQSKSRQRMLAAAADAGYTHFDTSPYYGFGLAEKELGLFMHDRRSEFTVTTKVGLYPRGAAAGNIYDIWVRKAAGKVSPKISMPIVNWSLERARASLYESLGRLRSDYVDFLLLHEPDFDLINTDEFMRWLEAEQEKGTIREWGVAGLRERIEPYVATCSPLANVIQTKDSLDLHEADYLAQYNRNYQFTYGYLSSLRVDGIDITPEDAIRSAMKRNQTGAVIISSRRIEHIISLAMSVT